MGLRNLVLAVLTIPKIVDDERMAQQLGGGPPLYRLPLQAAINEVPKISGSRWRRLRRIRHTYRTHKASPISLPTDSKRKPSQIELQYTNPETPYIACGTGVPAVIQIGVHSFGTHVSDRPYRRLARVHGLLQDLAHPKIGDLDLLARVDQ